METTKYKPRVKTRNSFLKKRKQKNRKSPNQNGTQKHEGKNGDKETKKQSKKWQY